MVTSGRTGGAAAICSRTEQPKPTQGGSISMLGGLSMCELSGCDERQQDEHEEGAIWNENELTDGHTIEVTDGRNIEVTDGH